MSLWRNRDFDDYRIGNAKVFGGPTCQDAWPR
jgi:hypothetical protein